MAKSPQPLDAVTLAHLARELNTMLAGAKVNKIQQATHTDVLFQLWSPSTNTTHRFYVDIRPQLAFCGVLGQAPGLVFPKTPLQLCVLLRKYLSGAKLRQVKALEGERVLILDFENYNEFAELCRYAVVIELMGKHSNIVLVDARVNVILATAHGVSDEMSRHRSLRIGDAYMPPPKVSGKPLLQQAQREDFVAALKQLKHEDSQTPESVAESLMAAFSGVGRATMLDVALASPELSPLALWDTWTRLRDNKALSLALTDDEASSLASGYRLLAAITTSTYHSVNDLVVAYYWPHAQEAQLASRKQSVQRVLQLQVDKIDKRLGVLEAYLSDDAAAAKSDADDQLMRLAEKQADDLAEDEDWREVQKGYTRYKKLKQRQNLAQEERTLLLMRQAVCDELAFWLLTAKTSEDMASVEEVMGTLDWLRSRHLKTSTAPKLSSASQPRKITLSSGVRIWVGKSALQNDWLIKHVARPGDRWFHVQYGPGAHVITQADKSLSDPVVLKTAQDIAAQLAVHFSPQRLGENVAVVTADSRHVKRVAAGPKGLVQFKQEESVFVTIDEDAVAEALELLAIPS